MARLFADENFPRPVVEALRSLGHDVLTVQQAGMANQAVSDEVVLAFATAQGRAVITVNRRHFFRLHASALHHAGIIICTQDADVGGMVQRIDQMVTSTKDLSGQLLRIIRPRR
jgi:predicted nuclease of predicted toxin-antitoxin system